MKICKKKFELLLADKCMSIGELLKIAKVSNRISAKLDDPECDFNPKTIGKIARALNVTPEYLTEEGGLKNDR